MPAVTPREAHRNRPEVAAPAEAKRSSGNGDRRSSVADEAGGVEAEGDVDDDDVPEVASSFVFPDRSLVDVARVIVERRATRTRREPRGARPTPRATRALVATGIAVAPEDVRSRCARAKKNEIFPYLAPTRFSRSRPSRYRGRLASETTRGSRRARRRRGPRGRARWLEESRRGAGWGTSRARARSRSRSRAPRRERERKPRHRKPTLRNSPRPVSSRPTAGWLRPLPPRSSPSPSCSLPSPTSTGTTRRASPRARAFARRTRRGNRPSRKTEAPRASRDRDGGFRTTRWKKRATAT